MYSVRHSAGAGAEPSYKGYKAMLVLLALAIVAIVVGLLLVGGGGDEGGSLGTDPGEVTVSGAETQELLRTAQTAIETYSTDNAGTYSGAQADDLYRIEPTLEGAPITVQADAKAYALSMPAGEVVFTLSRTDVGVTTFTCQPAGVAECPTTGTWG